METSTNLGRVSLVPRGAYDPAASYVRLDVVEYGGSSFLVLRDVQGAAPAEGPDYMLLAARGEVGPVGADGKEGPQGPAGQAFAILGYFDTAEALNAAVPAPEAGMAYGVGAAAPYDIYVWDQVHQEWKNNGSIQGPKGDTGATGPAGADGGTGPAGADGKSAYQYAQEGGYSGTEESFRELMGLTGTIAAQLDALNGEAV